MTVSSDVGNTLGSITQLMSNAMKPAALPSENDVVAKSLALAKANNERLDEVHAHPLGFGFLANGVH